MTSKENVDIEWLFPQFAALPYELRREIWLQCLADETPRAYTFMLFPISRSGPAQLTLGWDDMRKIQGFKDSTKIIRTIGSVCKESRDATEWLLPDTLLFKLPSRVYRDFATLRFSAKRDIIVLSAMTAPVHTSYAIRRHGLPEGLDIVQNLGLDTLMLEGGQLHKNRQLVLHMEPCDCEKFKFGCDYCHGETMPAFVELFPALKTLHIVEPSPVWMPSNSALCQCGLHEAPPVPPCVCPPPEVEGEDGNAGRLANSEYKHHWPRVRAMDNEWDWYISYPENGGCPFPTLPALEAARVDWHPPWPYYRALSHLDIRILRRLEKGS